MIDAYLDESGIHDNAKVCVIAGYFGTYGAMKKLELAWKKTLKRHKVEMKDFHAKTLIKKRTYLPLLHDLAYAVQQQKRVYPVSFGILVDDFFSLSYKQRRFMTGATIEPNTKKLVTSGCPSKPYFIPFQNILKIVTDNTPKVSKANFYFGIDKEFSEYAIALWRQIETTFEAAKRSGVNTWKTRERLGSASFPSAAQTAQLQAADFLVHVTYQHILLHQFNEKPSLGYSPEIAGSLIANTINPAHHGFQDRALLLKTLGQLPANLNGWDNI